MRLLVYKYLAESEIALSLSDLETYFEKSDKTTLYRTLKTFEQKNLVHSIDDGSRLTKYAFYKDECNCDLYSYIHLHFHCTQCDTTICLPGQKVPSFSLPEGFMATDANLVIKGCCSTCNHS